MLANLSFATDEPLRTEYC